MSTSIVYENAPIIRTENPQNFYINLKCRFSNQILNTKTVNKKEGKKPNYKIYTEKYRVRM